VQMRKDKVTLKNVIGVQEGHGPLAKETVVVGAHYDHLGFGGAGGSRASLRKMAIHHGADDNGSGSTSILELARRFGAIPKREGRRLVFMTFSGEELGLLGSKHYCKSPLYPLVDTVAMLNLDMVGRLKLDDKSKKDKLLIEAANTAKLFGEVLDTLNKKHDFEMVRSTEMLPNSDHFSFYQKEVPVLFFWTGLHADYHRPTDTSDKINVRGMRRVVDLSEDVLAQLATSESRPVYIKVKVAGGGGRGDGPKLGIMPGNYGEKGEGLLIDDVGAGGPAAKAGLKGGDVIVEMAGKPVKNIQTYMQIMGTQKKGDTIDVIILRDSKKQTVKVKLE
jgi:Peptidase family M28/PDZ domain